MKIIWINPLDRIEGLRNFKSSDVVIPFFEEHKHIIDHIIDVNFDPCVINGVQSYLDEWYFVGISSGAILSGTKKYLQNSTGLKWAIIAPDGGDFYLDTLIKYLDKDNFVGCK
jgi:cysteine synthase